MAIKDNIKKKKMRKTTESAKHVQQTLRAVKKRPYGMKHETCDTQACHLTFNLF